MNEPKVRVNWQLLALATGLVGFAMQTYSFVADGLQGNAANLLALRVLGVLGTLAWAVWVSLTLLKLTKVFSKETRSTELSWLQGFDVVKVYFDGCNRPFLKDLYFDNAGDTKGTPLEKQELGKCVPEGTALKLWRLHPKYRWILNVKRYDNTQLATD